MRSFCSFLLLLGCFPANAGAEATPFRSKEITFQGACETSLSGTLTLPTGQGPFPAIVLLGGSERLDRSGFYNWANANSLVSQGIAVFSFDSPGMGKSAGSRWGRTHEERTEDALAAIRAIAKRKDIDGNLIGLYGGSEGGVVVFRAASRSKGVAFGIAISAPAVPEIQATNSALRMLCMGTGLKGKPLEKLVAFNLLSSDLIRGRNKVDYRDLEKTVAKWNDPNWSQLISVLKKRNEENPSATQESFITISQAWEEEEWFQGNQILRDIQKQFIKSEGIDLGNLDTETGKQNSARRHIEFGAAALAKIARSDAPLAMVAVNDTSRDEDPVTFLKKINCPLLCIYGEKDQEMSEYPGIVRKALTDAKHNNFVVKVFPGAGHQLEVTKGKQTSRHPDFEEFILGWLQQQVSRMGARHPSSARQLEQAPTRHDRHVDDHR